MRVEKTRVIKKDGYFYPQYKWFFWWRNFTIIEATKADLYPYSITKDVLFDNKRDACDYAMDMKYSIEWSEK